MERSGHTVARKLPLETIKLKTIGTQRANSYFLLFLKGLTKSDRTPLYSTYQVNLLPLGGYAISIVANIGFNAISDWKQWRWQMAVFVAGIQVIALIPLCVRSSGYKVQYAFYFFTYLTAAWGYCLVSWLSDIYRREPEARAISIGTAVTLVYVGHATIPLRAFRVSDSPRYPIGFPLSLAFAVGSIITMLAMKIYVSKHEKLFDQPFLGAWTGNVQEEEDVEKLEDDEKLDAYRSDEQIQK
ncbi:major facilitator superfamily transporter [Moniliophthora roreri MCA 2997]|uniref:Major facilitator superfamily transporter n=1 Tax=Moniliophthora roreri (strain MCA 2997) TaxID=1381753 RepID=V2YKS2_MONRO|nr:major facilitator superfamily transporter [Moniliophthora roreri MCA 2997]